MFTFNDVNIIGLVVSISCKDAIETLDTILNIAANIKQSRNVLRNNFADYATIQTVHNANVLFFAFETLLY